MTPIEDLLRLVLEENSSDLHISAGSPPTIRINGHIAKLGLPMMTPADTEEMVRGIAKDTQIKQLYENGLSIQTGLDVHLQDAATAALDAGLRRVDKRRGFRKPRRNIIAEGHTVQNFEHPRWDRPMAVGDIVPAVVSGVDGTTIFRPGVR